MRDAYIETLQSDVQSQTKMVENYKIGAAESAKDIKLLHDELVELRQQLKNPVQAGQAALLLLAMRDELAATKARFSRLKTKAKLAANEVIDLKTEATYLRAQMVYLQQDQSRMFDDCQR